MRQIGAHVNTTESALLSLVGGAGHAHFKAVQAVIKELGPDTGLVAAKSSL